MPESKRSVTFLPEPEPREVKNLLISTDDHLVEPADMFEGRIPSALADQAPRIIEREGVQGWLLEDRLLPNVGLNAVAGRPPEEWNYEPQHFDDFRKGCYDIHARIHDMDLNGVYASVCFPSQIAGFGGARFAETKDADLGLALVKAWNDWHIEEWAAPYPERIIPIQIPWLRDPELTAKEIRRNAERGFKALAFPESPRHLGLPGLHTGYWDPIVRACAETGTVICLHTGSAGRILTDPEAPANAAVTLFPAYSLVCAVDWLWSGLPSRFPDVKIALAEGGIGWMPQLLDRLRWVDTHSGQAFIDGWTDKSAAPIDVLRRNFWFCMLDDPSAMPFRHDIGIDHITMEVDYPHADGTWPDTQAFVAKQLEGLPEDEIAQITHRNAAELFRHPLPDGKWIRKGIDDKAA
ncbi:amidohydrolase family protein [Streptomyces sp. MNU77]|uniref:amidohydrolase family protein n=1 Tax=Streptomyces sp. MNU77 TaxID=1573406 RepID=UPI000B243687|nr:amidohydrolase family protein [Streptomyces sp. MNU77]